MRTNGKIVLKIPKFNLSMFQVIILFLTSWVLFAFNTKTIDLENYKLFYTFANSGIRFPGIEIGYYYFIRTCSIFGLNFQQYMIVYSTIGLIIIFSSVKKYSDSSGFLPLLLFVFFPYFFFINVQRYFMATAIIIWSIRFLLYEDKWANIKFLVTILIASTFHIYSLIALIYLLTKFSNKKINIIVILIIIISIFFLLFRDQFFSLISVFIPKFSMYNAEQTRIDTKLFLVLYFICKIFISELYYKIIDQDILLKINKISALILPLSIISMDFMRIEYTMLIFMSIFIFNINTAKKELSLDYTKKIELFVVRFLYLIYYLLSAYILMYLYSYDSVVKTILENNLFYQLWR